jgi:nucleoside-diphosphate-sugar epimerase
MTAALGCHRFVGLGSQAEYGPQTGRIREDCPTRPTTLYGAAKLATCLMLERAAASSGRGFAWLRLFSTYGPGDDPSWMIPYLIRCLLARERPSLTAAEQVWDYLHVDDAAAAVVAVMDMDAVGVFNLGSGRASPLRDIVTFIRDCIDPALPLGLGEVPYRADQVMHLEADVSALHAATGWAPSVPLQDGLRAVVDDYRRRAPGLPAQ